MASKNSACTTISDTGCSNSKSSGIGSNRSNNNNNNNGDISDSSVGGSTSVTSAVKVPAGAIENVLDLIGGYLKPSSPPVAEAVAATTPVAPPAAFRGGARGVA